MHRSGTSALARVLNLMGATLPRDVMGPGPGNPKGHWEPNQIVALNETILKDAGFRWDDWRSGDLGGLTARRLGRCKTEIRKLIKQEYADASLFVLKDPRLSVLHPLYAEVLGGMDIDIRTVIALRNPLDVLASLERRDSLGEKDVARHLEAGRAQSALLWLRYMLSIEANTRGSKRAFVSYGNLLDDCSGTIAALSRQIGVTWPHPFDDAAKDIESFLQPAERHHASADGELALDTATRLWLDETYTALLDLERNPKQKRPLTALDRINADFARAEPLIAQLLDDMRQAHKADTRETVETLKRIQKENARNETELNAERARAEELTASLEDQKSRTRTAESRLRETQDTVRDMTANLAATQDALSQRDAEVRRQEAILAEQKTDIAELSAEVTRSHKKMSGLGKRIESMTLTTQDMARALTAADQEIHELAQRLKQATSQQASGTAQEGRRNAKLRGSTGLTHRMRDTTDAFGSFGKKAADTAILPFRWLGAVLSRHTRSTGDTEPVSLAEQKRRLLAHQLPLDQQVEEWSRPPPDETLETGQLTERLRALCSGESSRIILSLSHDNYTVSVGGLQLCVQIEERKYAANGDVYLNLHPQSPAPTLAPNGPAGTFHYSIAANGEIVGSVSAATLMDVFSRLRSHGVTFQCIVHSLIGHAPELVEQLLDSCNVKSGAFWLHDYFALCPSYTLLRNQISFCNAPDTASSACGTCLFGEHRGRHLERLDALFRAVDFQIISPSQYALDLWQRASRLPCSRSMVLSHCSLEPERTLPAGNANTADTPIRIGFLGYPEMHKGWPVFAEMASEFADDRNYEFYHLGKNDTGHRNIRFRRTETTHANPDAMRNAIVDNGIDAVLLWALWPETFSFTLHEALAANAFVVTSAASGNIQAVLARTGAGAVLREDQPLKEYLRSEEFVGSVRANRKNERIVSRLVSSSMSFGIAS